jgi:hypothetical protein
MAGFLKRGYLNWAGGLAAAVIMAVSGLEAGAATPYRRALDSKQNRYVTEGVFTGGRAGLGSSILAVRRSYSAKARLERVVVDLGDREAKPAGTSIGYFQAALDPGRKRLVLDISQLRLSKVSEQQVQRLFKKSPYVSSVELTLDPEDKAATMVLNLKRPMRVEVFQLLKAKAPGRIVMDLAPAASTPARRRM